MLQVVELSYNPLDCSCSLAWLRSALLSSLQNSSRATCSSPTELAGLELRAVLPSQLR